MENKIAEEDETKLIEKTVIEKSINDKQSENIIETFEKNKSEDKIENKELDEEHISEDVKKSLKESSDKVSDKVLVENKIGETRESISIEETEIEKLNSSDKKDSPVNKKSEIKSTEKNEKISLSNIDQDKSPKFKYTAHDEGDFTKVEYYYTIKLISVSNASDGLLYISKIKDNDQIWNEYGFHLYKDEFDENITKITLGKFAEKQKFEQ